MLPTAKLGQPKEASNKRRCGNLKPRWTTRSTTGFDERATSYSEHFATERVQPWQLLARLQHPSCTSSLVFQISANVVGHSGDSITRPWSTRGTSVTRLAWHGLDGVLGGTRRGVKHTGSELQGCPDCLSLERQTTPMRATVPLRRHCTGLSLMAGGKAC